MCEHTGKRNGMGRGEVKVRQRHAAPLLSRADIMGRAVFCSLVEMYDIVSDVVLFCMLVQVRVVAIYIWHRQKI